MSVTPSYFVMCIVIGLIFNIGSVHLHQRGTCSTGLVIIEPLRTSAGTVMSDGREEASRPNSEEVTLQ